jgi:energy-coupling factor transporter ATP-binding protein EcfA2
MTEQQAAITFRAELLEQVMPVLRAGECCSLVGTSGAGKSNLARFLRRRDVQAQYWGEQQCWFVVVDTNGLALSQLPEAVVLFESMLHHLLREAAARHIPPEPLAEMSRMHAELVRHPNEVLALRYLDRALGWLIEGHDVRIVFVFDQFDDLWKTMHARIFLNLRYLRDEFKYRLVYLVMTRERLQQLRERAKGDLAEVEAFWELFTANVFGVSVYGPRDTEEMIANMARRRQVTLTPELRRITVEGSGGHPGLLRAIFWAALGAAGAGGFEPLTHPTVAEECAKIWHGLHPEERDLVRVLVAGEDVRQYDALVLEELRVKQLVVADAPALFSPVFGAFVERQGADGEPGLVLDTLLRKIWIDGRALELRLSPLEFRLLEHLARAAGAVCEREALLRALYGDQEFFAKSDERLDAVVRRLRSSLGDDAREPRFIVVERGVGVRLANGRLRA